MSDKPDLFAEHDFKTQLPGMFVDVPSNPFVTGNIAVNAGVKGYSIDAQLGASIYAAKISYNAVTEAYSVYGGLGIVFV